MPGFLFHDVIFGPVRSRRLGLSLGINLLPAHSKYCSFDCVYCECGWTDRFPGDEIDLPTRNEVKQFLELKLQELVSEDYLPDALTYAGNGEPTLHPEFPSIVDDTIELRNKYVPHADVAILSNASMTGDPGVFNALLKLDKNIQKLDSGSDHLARLINRPFFPGNLNQTVENLRKFDGKVIIQSLFLRGTIKGQAVDNTSEHELKEWLEKIRYIHPEMVMIYSLDRATPSDTLSGISPEELEDIAGQVKKLGIKTAVY